MESWSLASPPHVGGVYAIEHVLSGDVYIGQTNDLCRRLAGHRSTVLSKRSNCSFSARAASDDLVGWRFFVVAVLPGVSGEDLLLAESWAISFACWCGRRVLNVQEPTIAISCADGSVMGVRAASRLLGVSRGTLKHRLLVCREAGLPDWTVLDPARRWGARRAFVIGPDGPCDFDQAAALLGVPRSTVRGRHRRCVEMGWPLSDVFDRDWVNAGNVEPLTLRRALRVGGRTVAECAAALGVSVTCVRGRLARVRALGLSDERVFDASLFSRSSSKKAPRRAAKRVVKSTQLDLF